MTVLDHYRLVPGQCVGDTVLAFAVHSLKTQQSKSLHVVIVHTLCLSKRRAIANDPPQYERRRQQGLFTFVVCVVAVVKSGGNHVTRVCSFKRWIMQPQRTLRVGSGTKCILQAESQMRGKRNILKQRKKESSHCITGWKTKGSSQEFLEWEFQGALCSCEVTLQ